MGFLNTLEKIYNGVGDIMITVGNQLSGRIDRMTDEEIEKRFSKPADEIRRQSKRLQMQTERLQMEKEKREIEAEINYRKNR